MVNLPSYLSFSSSNNFFKIIYSCGPCFSSIPWHVFFPPTFTYYKHGAAWFHCLILFLLALCYHCHRVARAYQVFADKNLCIRLATAVYVGRLWGGGGRRWWQRGAYRNAPPSSRLQKPLHVAGTRGFSSKQITSWFAVRMRSLSRIVRKNDCSYFRRGEWAGILSSWMIASLRKAAERLKPQPWSYDSKVNLSLWMLSLLGVEADWDSEFIAASPF